MSLARPVIFTRVASAELTDAQDWYEDEVSGLGSRFRVAVDAVLARMRENPLQFPVVYKTVRRALVRQFPYALLFVIDPDDALTVIACFHGSRDPGHWRKRV